MSIRPLQYALFLFYTLEPQWETWEKGVVSLFHSFGIFYCFSWTNNMEETTRRAVWMSRVENPSLTQLPQKDVLRVSGLWLLVGFPPWGFRDWSETELCGQDCSALPWSQRRCGSCRCLTFQTSYEWARPWATGKLRAVIVSWGVKAPGAQCREW